MATQTDFAVDLVVGTAMWNCLTSYFKPSSASLVCSAQLLIDCDTVTSVCHPYILFAINKHHHGDMPELSRLLNGQ